MQAPPTPQGNLYDGHDDDDDGDDYHHDDDDHGDSDDYHHGDADCDHDGGDIIMKKTSYRTG